MTGEALGTYRKFRKLKGRLNAGVITDDELEQLNKLSRKLSVLESGWRYRKLKR